MVDDLVARHSGGTRPPERVESLFLRSLRGGGGGRRSLRGWRGLGLVARGRVGVGSRLGFELDLGCGVRLGRRGVLDLRLDGDGLRLGNVIMSSAPPAKTNEAGGLQGAAQNLGASLGTALIGSVLLTGLLTGFQDRIAENPSLSEPVRAELTAATQQGIEIVTTEQANAVVTSAGLSATEADAVTADYADAQLDALKKAMLAVALLALLSLLFTRRLPGKPSTAGTGAA